MALPEKLYKYQPINTLTLSNLSNRQLYFSNPVEFNDPYDCALELSFKDLKDEEYIALLEKFFEKKFDDRTKEEILKIIKDDYELSQEYREKIDLGLNRSLDDIKNNFFSQRGISSLSRKKDDILMWAHYSDGHRGFCLEFDTSCDPFDNAKQVNYSVEIPKLDVSKILLSSEKKHDEHIISPLTTKYSCWEYEEEYRIIHQEASKIYYYTAEALTGIYFGSEMDRKHRDICAMILKQRNPDVKFYVAKRRKESFKIEFEEVFFREK